LALNAIHKPLEGGFPALFHLLHIKYHMLIARFAVLVVVLSLSGQIQAQSAASSQACTLRIHVDGLRNSTGVVGTELFTSSAGWPENVDKTFRHGATPIGAAERAVTVVWQNIPPGNYGVVALHDENKNRKLDRNIFGVPKEGFGFANNPHVGMSAPPFEQAILRVTCPVTETTIHLIYK
jgi:uncharacterized protein (DUF2141 family)